MASTANCFVSEPLINPVEVTDVVATTSGHQAHGQHSGLRQAKFVTKSGLAEYLDSPSNQDYKCRYISICQRNSWQPLQITEEMLDIIMTRHDLGPSLWDLTSVFYTRNLKTEQVFCVPYTEYWEGSFIDISYTIRYPEYKKSNDEWTIRQSGIYHRFNTETSQSTVILFSPTPNSKLHCDALKWLAATQQQPDGRQKLETFFWLHQKLFATYFNPAWRKYIASLEHRFLPIANTASATYISEELRLGHGHLTALISIQKDFMQIPVMLAAAGDVLTELSSLKTTILHQEQQHQQFRNIQRQCGVYSRTAAHLQERVQVTAQLLSDTLLFRDQVLAKEQNGNMLQLNRSAFFLTTLTLLYLPASFLTSFFGMNFFALNQQDNKIIGTSMIWIFVLSATVLTAATFALYHWLAHHDSFMRIFAPNKWISADINLRTLRRRMTGERIDDASDQRHTAV